MTTILIVAALVAGVVLGLTLSASLSTNRWRWAWSRSGRAPTQLQPGHNSTWKDVAEAYARAEAINASSRWARLLCAIGQHPVNPAIFVTGEAYYVTGCNNGDSPWYEDCPRCGGRSHDVPYSREYKITSKDGVAPEGRVSLAEVAPESGRLSVPIGGELALVDRARETC